MSKTTFKPSHEAIYVVTATTQRGNSIKQAIELRDFDEVLCIPVANAENFMRTNPPALVIIDTEGDVPATLQLIEKIPPVSVSLVLSEAFNEDLFIACHDKGVRDFLVKPVSNVYLVSRMIRALQDRRGQQLLGQKDRILTELGVLSEQSGAYSTPFLIKLLKETTEFLPKGSEDKLSLLILQMEGYTSPIKNDALRRDLYSGVAQIIKECSRGFDMVGEYYMDKFAVVLPYTGTGGAKALASRLGERLEGFAVKQGDEEIRLKIRIGLTDYKDCRHYEDLIDKAMKRLGPSLQPVPAK